jgi:hypothetical protein
MYDERYYKTYDTLIICPVCYFCRPRSEPCPSSLSEVMLSSSSALPSGHDLPLAGVRGSGHGQPPPRRELSLRQEWQSVKEGMSLEAGTSVVRQEQSLKQGQSLRQGQSTRQAGS